METNKQNTALLIVIAVATLLVAVVGATFAYFTATSNKAEASTVQVQAGTMKIKFTDGDNGITVDDFQPKEEAIAEKTFTLTGTNTTQDLKMPFTIDLVYNNGFTAEKNEGTPSGNGGITYTFEQTQTSKDATIDSIVSAGMLDTGSNTLTVAKGSFAANKTEVTIGFKLTLYFKDTGVAQDDNKGAELRAYFKVNQDESQNIAK